jgi:hypothetical protein
MKPVTLRPIFVEVLPDFDAIKLGDIWISHKHRTINMRCPCGCGDLTVLTLHPSRWHVHFDGKSVSLDGPTGGSVWAYSGCRNHYGIQNNNVIWLDGIDPSRHAEYADAERSRMLDSKPSRQTLGSLVKTLRRSLTLWKWRPYT